MNGLQELHSTHPRGGSKRKWTPHRLNHGSWPIMSRQPAISSVYISVGRFAMGSSWRVTARQTFLWAKATHTSELLVASLRQSAADSVAVAMVSKAMARCVTVRLTSSNN